MDAMKDADIPMLRHTLAALAYRAAKVLRGVPPGFAHFRAAATTRTAGEILAHMGDLFDWAVGSADGRTEWRELPPGPWERDVARFFAALKDFDDRLDSAVPLAVPAKKLFQGPVADALTHVGQLATLRRLAGAGIRGENYFKAEIKVGRVGMDQAPAVFEFD